jgi:hypothetical protein
VSADAVDQQGHLVADLSDVGGVLGQHGEVRPVADAHQQQVALLHLDDRLQDRAAVEEARGADREAGQPRGHRGHLLGPVLRDAGAGGHQQAIGGDQDRVGGRRDLLDEAGHHPVELAGRAPGRGSG